MPAERSGRKGAGKGDDKPSRDEDRPDPKRPANVAPDAVKDPSEKTGGKPGLPQGHEGGEADPGSG